MLGDSWPHQALGPSSPGQLPSPTPATQLGFTPRYEAAGMWPIANEASGVLAEG